MTNSSAQTNYYYTSEGDILSGFNRRVMIEINKEKDRIKNRKENSNNSTQTTQTTQPPQINQEKIVEDHELKIHDILKSIWTDDDKEIVLRCRIEGGNLWEILSNPRLSYRD